jgi:hypothetical protein
VNLLARLHDSNVYVLDEPSLDLNRFTIGMIHPFDLDGEGFQARVYRFSPRRVEFSPAAEEATRTGWGIDGVDITARGAVTLSNDDELWIRIELSLPCEVDVKSVMLKEHPEEEGLASYLALRGLEANREIAWETTPVVRCEPHSS